MNNNLKIGVVVDQLLAGGVQLAAIEQVKELNKLGHHAKLLILMRKKYPIDFSYLVKGVPHQYLSDSYPPLFRRTIKFPIFSFLSTLHLMSPILAPRTIKKEDYDILLSWGTTTCLTTQAIWKNLKIPYIAIIHDPIMYILEKVYSNTYLKYFFPILRPLAQFFEESFVKDAAQTLLISHVHARFVKKRYAITPKILHLGVKPARTIPKKRGGFLLSFGRWQKEKNPHFLLNILKKIPEVRLSVAGTWISNKDLTWFKNKVRKDGLQERVSIILNYKEQELAQLASGARVFLHPHFEAFGLAALEAAGLGLPIIIPGRSGVTEKFVDGVHGFFPQKATVASFVRYVRKLLNDERLAYRMGQAAWEKVKQEFSWEAHTKDLLRIVNWALDFPEKPEIVVLETGHALGAPQGAALAGGDRLMEPMAIRLASKFRFTIIVSSIGAGHWRKAPLVKKMKVLPKNRFDASGNPIPVFLTYLARMWRTYTLLKNHTTINTFRSQNILYSSTNVLPDVLPAYLFKGQKPGLLWVARVHHLIPPPYRREGTFIVNVVSYFMQSLALFMIKNRADIIIALNQGLKGELMERGLPKEKLKVLGAGIDFEKITSQKIMPGTTSYDGIFVGRLHPVKGIFDLVTIWKRVVSLIPQAKLAIIGGGPQHLRDSLLKLIKREGLSKNIIVTGFLTDKILYSTMKKAQVFLFTDHEAGFGLAVAEAMAAGLPVVGWDIGILGTVYKTGFKRVPLGEYKLFSNEIISLLKDAYQREQLAQKAKREAAQLDWIQTSNKFRRILGKIENR